MSADQVRQTGDRSRFPWTRRQSTTSHRSRPATPIAAQPAPHAVDPLLVAAPLDSAAAIERGVVAFAATLTSPVDGAPIAGATVLFQVSVAARTAIKCQAITDAAGVARTESTLPPGLLDRQPIEYRVSFTGAPPAYWPVSVAGTIV